MVLKKKGYQWILYNHTGKKVLGKFKTRKAALKRERAIQYYKHLKRKK